MILAEDVTYFHSSGEMRLFKAGEDSPGDGWSTEPTSAAFATLLARIAELEAQVAAFDHDGDGKPGGRRKK